MKNLAYRFLTCSLALLLAINTAAAGRWLRSCWDAPACGPMIACDAPCEPVGCCPVEAGYEVSCGSPCEPAGCGATTVDDCGCGSATGETVLHESVATPTEAVAPPQPTEVFEPAPADAFGGGFRSDNATAQDAAPSDDWNAGFEEPVAEPTPAEEPAEELFVEPAPIEETTDELFANPAPAPAQPVVAEPIDEPADDLFAEEPVAEEPAEDLFGAPAEEPMEDEGDLFGAPAEEAAEEPADDLFGEPAAEEPPEEHTRSGALVEEPADDLFAEPAEEEPADDLFGAEEEPMEDEGNLFGAPAEEAAEEPVDDLFGEPAAEEPADDLFGEPAEEPMEDEGDLFGAPAEEATEEPADDLFGEPVEAVEEAADDLFGPDDNAPADEAVEDDLFGGFGAILSEPGGVDGVAQRTWVDNTGRFSTVGRLLAIDGGSIRLAKENGAVATVPLSRLSQSDLEFVSRQSVAMHQAREHAIARGATPADDAKQARTDDELPLRTAQL